MIGALSCESPCVVELAAVALGQMRVTRLLTDQAASPAVPALIGALKHPRYRVRRRVVFTLRYMGTIAAEAIPALIDALEDPEFGFLKPEDGEVVADSSRSSDCSDIRWCVAAALGEIYAAPSVIEALAKALGDPNECVASSAASVLGGWGLTASPASPALASYLERLLNKEKVEGWPKQRLG